MQNDGATQRETAIRDVLMKLVDDHGVAAVEAMASLAIEGMVLSRDGKLVFANRHFLDLIAANDDDILGIDICDLVAPEERQSVVEHLRQRDESPYETVLKSRDGEDLPVLVCPSYLTIDGETHRLAGFLDLRPVKQRELAVRRALESTTFSLSRAIEARDPYTAGHMDRVATIGRLIATELNLPPEDIDAIAFGARVHDIGKLGVPVEILTKPNRLEAWEWHALKQHPTIGAEILRDIEFPWPVQEIVRHHHERCDGSGYPDGLAGEEIPLLVRIVAVADALEAITGVRPYHRYRSFRDALDILHNETGRYDADILQVTDRLEAAGRLEGLSFDGVDAPADVAGE